MPDVPDYSSLGQGQNQLLGQLKGMGDLATQVNQNRLLNTQNQSQQLDIAVKRLNATNQVMSSLMSKEDLSHQDMKDAIVDLVGKGIMPADDAAKTIQSFSGLPDTPQANQQYLMPHALQGLDAMQRINTMYGTVNNIDTGKNLVLGTQSPVYGYKKQGNVPLGLNPETASSPVQVYNPTTRQPGLITREQFANQAAPNQLMGAIGKQPQNQLMAGAGANDDAALEQELRDSIPGSRTSESTKAIIPTGPALGESEAYQVSGKENAEQGVRLQQEAEGSPQRKALLGELEGTLSDFKSGPGSDTRKDIMSRLNAIAPADWNIAPSRIASQEEFNKLSTQLAQAQFKSLGGTGTDNKLDSAINTSPNSALSSLGNKRIIALLKGNEDAISVKNQEWQQYLKSGGSPADYGQFTAKFNKSYDPRAFQMQYMDNKAIGTMLNGMGASEKDKFRQTFNAMVDNGWVPDKRSK